MTPRAELFRKTCELIADDRKAVGRDDSHHRWLVQQIDDCVKAIAEMYKKINRMLDQIYN